MARGRFKKKQRVLSGRLAWVMAFFMVLTLGYVLRLGYLQIIMADEWSEAAAASRTISVELPARRGTIYDRNGNVLASSVEATTIYANPQEIEDVEGTAEALAEVLGGDADDYTDYLTQDTTFVYVQRQADKELGDELEALGLEGIYFIEDTKRVYPYGESAGQVVGLVDVDGNGLTGLELYYDDILSGTSGLLVQQIGGEGIPIPDGVEIEEAAVDGQDIIVSIDISLQTALEECLAEGVESLYGSDGKAVVMDASTGEILAIAATPYLDPSDLSDMEVGADTISAISLAFEPGSIFKTVSAMALLEAGAITPETVIYGPEVLQADEYEIYDSHESTYETMTFREILNQSSNIGMSLSVSEYLGFSELYEKILTYGVTELTGVDYPGEGSGYVSDVSSWSTVQSYNVTFGQGITVTPLAMVRFYGALANNGVATTPHFLISQPQSGEEVSYDTEQIIENTEAIETMISMLETVVSEGTGTAAAIDGYTVVGKTGTAEYVGDEGTYVSGSWNLSFVGFLPDASLPLVCFVGVDEVPSLSSVASIFHDIMANAISRYGIVQQ